MNRAPQLSSECAERRVFCVLSKDRKRNQTDCSIIYYREEAVLTDPPLPTNPTGSFLVAMIVRENGAIPTFLHI